MRHPAARWRSAVEASGRSQRQVAALALVSEKHLSQILTGKVLPSVDLVIRLSRTLGVDARERWLEQAEFVLWKAAQES